MTKQHPITPPPEMVEKWVHMFECLPDKQVFSEVAQWGADQELEAVEEEIITLGWFAKSVSVHHRAQLRAARRPKPPSLKEQLLQKLEHIRDVADKYQSTQNAIDDLRETLEALDD